MPSLLRKIFCSPLFKTYRSEAVDSPGSISNKKSSIFTKILRVIAIFIVLTASLIIIFNSFDEGIYDDEYFSSDYQEDGCNVSGISIIGDIVTLSGEEETVYTSADDIIYNLQLVEDDKESKALFIEIDSVGGYPVAAEEIAMAIKRLNKPTVALIREYGDSAAYWVASAADTIFASRSSELGSIGVTSSYLDYTDQNQKDGIKFIELSSGKYKNIGDPDKPLTQEEKDLMMRDINILHQNFVEAVAENRNMDIEKVKQLADGSAMLGQMALDNGLIDKIGVYHDALDYLEELLGEKPEICWY
ncbi:MAG: signal peptide peptidase SppA [Patescibacteria group bacterium]|nr:signal peptide peptidase SppA [Bacteroidales bacterium]MDD3777863.1 signal peptide peptidase SppA [Patescibacteria group bacterium]